MEYERALDLVTVGTNGGASLFGIEESRLLERARDWRWQAVAAPDAVPAWWPDAAAGSIGTCVADGSGRCYFRCF